MSEEVKNLIREVIKNNTIEYRQLLVMEECAELIQAFTKNMRGRDNYINVIEEIADVLVVVFAYIEKAKIPAEQIDSIMAEKIRRAIIRRDGM